MGLTTDNSQGYLQYLSEYTGKGDAKGYIDQRVASANHQIEEAETRLATANDAIDDWLANAETGGLDDVPDWDVTPPDFDPDALKDEEAPESPDLTLPDSIEIDAMEVEDWELGNEVDLPPDPVLMDVRTTMPNAPAISINPPDVEVNFSPDNYTSGLADYLQSKIEDALDGLGNMPRIDLSPHVDLEGNTESIELVDYDIEQAIYDRAVSRMDDEEADAIEQAESAIQARGFSLPPGALSAIITNIQNNATKAKEDLNRDIISSSIQLEQKRTEYELQKAGQMTDAQYKYDSLAVEIERVNADYTKAMTESYGIFVDAGTKLEGIAAEVHNREQQLMLDAEEKSVDAAVKVYNAKVEQSKAVMEAFKIETDAAVAQMRADIEYNTNVIEIFKSRLEAVKTNADIERIKLEGRKVNADIALAKMRADIETVNAENARLAAIAEIYSSEVRAYASKIEALRTAETLDLQRYDIESRGMASQISSLVQKASAEVDYAVKQAALQIETLKAEASLSAGIISAALNSLNTSASFSYAGGIKASRGYDETIGIRYGYSYSGNTEDVNSPNKEHF